MLLTKWKRLRQFLGVLETFNLLFIRLAMRNPARLRLFPNKIFRQYMSLVERDKWMCKDIFAVLDIPERTRIVVEHLPGRGIDTPLDELAYLALISAATKPRNIFEIGTFRGRTALNFAANSPEDCVVWTLDLPPEEKAHVPDETNPADGGIIKVSSPVTDYEGKDAEHKIRQLYGNSLEYDFSPYFGEMDIVFVDGAHHYRAVRSDTANALRMAKRNGFVIWHDFANYGDYNDVTRAVLDTLPGEKIVQIADTQLAVYRHLAGEDSRL